MAIRVRKSLEELLRALEATDVVWTRLAADASSGPWTLRLLELTSGAAPPNWREINWRYTDYVFSAREINGATLARWLQDEAIPVDDLSIPAAFQPDVQRERRESGWGTNTNEPLIWPFEEWQLQSTQNGNSPVSHELVAEGLPYFHNPDIPTATLLGVPYTGFNVHGREFLWREQDTSGRLANVRVDAAGLTVTAEGDEVEGALVELAGIEPGPTENVVSADKPIHMPLPYGLPDFATVVLRRGDRWLDRVNWSGRDKPANVDFVLPPESRLEAIVSAGEGSTTEFKEQLPARSEEGRKKVMKTVAAFANGNGGTLLFGVAKDGVICGLSPEEDTPDTLDTLALLVKSWVHPLPGFDIEAIPLPDDPNRHVVALTVESGDHEPYAAGTTPDRMTFYVRRGATTFSVMPEEVRALVLRSQPSNHTRFPRPRG